MEICPDDIEVRPGLILVKRELEGEKTSGGLFLPDYRRKVSQKAIVVKVGSDPDHKFDPSVKAGDIVYSHGHAIPQASFKWQGQEYDILVFGDIEAVGVPA